ncbi:MAG TPA: DUF5615 family PIN-like protein [Longimicrobium sp.]|nr:DUF5615 family PIN-like protein [Longimicrobium sp.]
MTEAEGEARLYLDEDIPYRAADVATALGLDAIAARVAHESLPQDDAFHLQTAAADRRVMVTYNRDDFLLATRDAFAAGRPHAGLLVLTRKLPRDPARIGHALDRWVQTRVLEGRWPMQPFEVDFLSE